jgi:putative protease
MEEEKKLVGKIIHYYQKINVAIVEVSDDIKNGDQISIEGPTTNLRQVADSMQIEHKNIEVAKSGQSIGLKVAGPVKEKDNVYKVVAQ